MICCPFKINFFAPLQCNSQAHRERGRERDLAYTATVKEWLMFGYMREFSPYLPLSVVKTAAELTCWSAVWGKGWETWGPWAPRGAALSLCPAGPPRGSTGPASPCNTSRILIGRSQYRSANPWSPQFAASFANKIKLEVKRMARYERNG